MGKKESVQTTPNHVVCPPETVPEPRGSRLPDDSGKKRVAKIIPGNYGLVPGDSVQYVPEE